eukprot:Sspe_Gene.113496::Locus_97874_Transcript_2_3_Confidence_0.714_Length_372::g.113496::m.113496
MKPLPFSVTAVVAKLRSLEFADPSFFTALGGVVLLATGGVGLATGSLEGAFTFILGAGVGVEMGTLKNQKRAKRKSQPPAAHSGTKFNPSQVVFTGTAR